MEGEITEAIRVRLPPEPIFQYYVNFRFFLNVLLRLIDGFLNTPSSALIVNAPQTRLFGFELIDSYSYPHYAVYSYRPSLLVTRKVTLFEETPKP